MLGGLAVVLGRFAAVVCGLAVVLGRFAAVVCGLAVVLGWFIVVLLGVHRSGSAPGPAATHASNRRRRIRQVGRIFFDEFPRYRRARL
ncbi:hypothetical protein C6W10_28275 [Plantactinospora sp. BB1]|nr:hypothetical protein C6W10_28275 [Plantactinospora sp. BB1]